MPTPTKQVHIDNREPDNLVKIKKTHDEFGNRLDGRESYAAFIKRSRASNYTNETSLSEFTDNSIEAGAKKIKITYSDVKICHHDNGSGIANILESSTIGVNRSRDDNGDGDYGKGYKEGSTSLANMMCVYTYNGSEYMFGKWDVELQKKNDKPTPEVSGIDKSTFGIHSQFLKGTTFEFSALTLIGSSYDKQNLYKEYKKRYKYKFMNGDVEEIMIDNLTLTKEKYTNSIECDKEISKYYIYQHKNTQKIIVEDEKKNKDIEPNLIKKKNGNFMACTHVSKKDKSKFNLVDSITWTSRSYKDIPKTSELNDMNYPGGKVNIRRKNLVTSSISFRNERGDNWCSHIEHELYYTKSSFDSIIGSNSNKQHAGSCPVKELESILSWIQTIHEAPFVKKRKALARAEKNVKKKTLKNAKSTKKLPSDSTKYPDSEESGSEEESHSVASTEAVSLSTEEVSPLTEVVSLLSGELSPLTEVSLPAEASESTPQSEDSVSNTLENKTILEGQYKSFNILSPTIHVKAHTKKVPVSFPSGFLIKKFVELHEKNPEYNNKTIDNQMTIEEWFSILSESSSASVENT